MPQGQQDRPLLRQLIDASSVGLQLVISTFVGFAIGYFLDRFFKTSPWLTIIFLIIGIVAGFLELLRIARKQNGPDKNNS